MIKEKDCLLQETYESAGTDDLKRLQRVLATTPSCIYPSNNVHNLIRPPQNPTSEAYTPPQHACLAGQHLLKSLTSTSNFHPNLPL